jgi:hypothetical protein
VAEEPSSEPTAKNYSLRDELAQNRGILRSPCGRFWGELWRRNGGEGDRHTCWSITLSLLI